MASRVRATGLEYTMEHPASSRRMATVHRTVAFTWVRARRLYQNKKGARRLPFLLNVEMEKRPQPHQRKESTSYQNDVLSFMKEFG